MIAADAQLATPETSDGGNSDSNTQSARRESRPGNKLQRNWLAKWLLAGCKNLYYLQFALFDGLAAALWRGCSFGRQQAENALCWTFPCPTLQHPDELLSWLRQQGLQVIDAEHALYLPPQAALLTTLPEIANFYPPCCGFKILKDLRGPAESNYLAGRPDSVLVRRRLTGSPAEHLVTANYMHTLGIGPRVWDLCRWQGDSNQLTVFVVEHIAGRSPTDVESRGFLSRLGQIAQNSHLRILMPRWETQDDFESPTCRGNLIASAEYDSPQYVDFQNFRLCEPEAWTQEIRNHAEQADPQSQESLTNEAARGIVSELHNLGVRLRGRMVRHLECGMGELLNAALNAGAAWVSGSTTAEQSAAATANLYSQGAGRFTIHADGTDFEDDPHLSPAIRGRWADSILICQWQTQEPEKLLERVARLEWKTLVCLTNPAEGTDDSILSRLNSSLEVTMPVAIAHTPVDSQRPHRVFVVNKA